MWLRNSRAMDQLDCVKLHFPEAAYKTGHGIRPVIFSRRPPVHASHIDEAVEVQKKKGARYGAAVGGRIQGNVELELSARHSDGVPAVVAQVFSKEHRMLGGNINSERQPVGGGTGKLGWGAGLIAYVTRWNLFVKLQREAGFTNNCTV